MTDEARFTKSALWGTPIAELTRPDGLCIGSDYGTRPHAPNQFGGPQGPNEDIAQCPNCLTPIGSLRPAGETYGVHADDCSLPARHPGYCVGGGSGHPAAAVIRGFFGPDQVTHD